MIMFVKHSNDISHRKKASITRSFMLVFSKVEDFKSINDMRDELKKKEKAQKKQQIYAEMYDAQIDAIICAIMSVSDAEKGKRRS